MTEFSKTVKRGFNKKQAMDYLGVKAKFFDLHLMPLLKDKAIRAGISLVFQRDDLDEAWDRYTLTADGNRAVNTEKGDFTLWHEQKRPVFSRKKAEPIALTRGSETSAFLKEVSQTSKTRKTGF